MLALQQQRNTNKNKMFNRIQEMLQVLDWMQDHQYIFRPF